MKFLKGMIAGKKAAEEAEEQSGLSIEDLQRDLDHSGMEQTLRGPDSAWSEKAAQRPADEAADARIASGDLEWGDELGDAFASPGGKPVQRPSAAETTPDDDDFSEFDDEFDDEFDELEPEEEEAIRDNALLVEEIRDAIAAVRHIETNDAPASDDATKAQDNASKRGSWEQDDVFGRKALARDQLKGLAEGADSERILEETNHKMDDDDEANRRRLAMAHLKAAAAATKADSVLKRVVGRDPATDMEQQVQYREDLANVVRQRGPRSEAISRPLSRPVSRPYSQAIQPEAAQPTSEPSNVEALRAEYSEPVAEAPDPLPTAEPQIPDTTEEASVLRDPVTPPEAPMDVEKLDLKTALERQKAILKAEREALEAEMAGEERIGGEEAEDRADDAFKEVELASADAEDEAPELVASVEAPEEDEADEASAFDAVDEDDDDFDAEPIVEEVAEGNDDILAETTAADDADDATDDEGWDDGLEDVTDVEAEVPVDLTQIEDAPVVAEAQPEPTPEVAETNVRELDISEEPAAVEPVEAAAAAPRRTAGRVKTRLLGFQSKTPGQDVFEGKTAEGAGPIRFPVGWLVITKGEGFGHSFSLLSGVSKIGRGEDQAVKLDFGDTAISRDNHAAIAFDDELNQFFLGHGGKSNVVRLNGKPVLSTEELFDGDEIRIGETTLKFIALCGDEFTWAQTEGNGSEHAASA